MNISEISQQSGTIIWMTHTEIFQNEPYCVVIEAN